MAQKVPEANVPEPWERRGASHDDSKECSAGRKLVFVFCIIMLSSSQPMLQSLGQQYFYLIPRESIQQGLQRSRSASPRQCLHASEAACWTQRSTMESVNYFFFFPFVVSNVLHHILH
jgi:hypothetical protein